MSIRCFIAIELDNTIHKKLAHLQGRLTKKFSQGKKVRWVKSEQIHLTLKFLGEVDDAAIPEICAAVSDAAAQCQPFDFEIGNCGCFGSSTSARIIWVGVTDGLDQLQTLQQTVEHNLADIGFPPERRKFNPHLTLARIRNVNTGSVVRRVVDKLDPLTLGTQSVSEITVFQSELTPAGPIYTPLHHAHISTKP